MRIAIFSESYEPIINGVSVFVGTLRDELVKRGNEVYIFAPDYKGHSDSYDHVYRIPSVHTFLMPDYPFPLPFAGNAKKAFFDLDLDIVHTQTPFTLGLLGARWAREKGVPFVSTNHTLYTEYLHYVPIRPKWMTRRIMVDIIKWYYSGCDAVVVPSGPVKDRLRGYGVSGHIEVIKTGVVGVPPSDENVRRQVREAYGIGSSQKFLLYVGRIAREKNLAMMLEALKIITDKEVDAKLVMMGGGPALKETQVYAKKLGIEDRVVFGGMLPRTEIAPLYGTADLFLFPSATETQGIAICEALSAGLPVVAVNAGGIPENVSHGEDGFLTENSAEDFSGRMMEILSDEDKRKQMAEAAKINSERFSIDRMVADFEDFYRTVIENSSVRQQDLQETAK